VTADVEVVPVAPAQPKGDAMPQETWAELWTPGLRMAQVESWALLGHDRSIGRRAVSGTLREHEVSVVVRARVPYRERHPTERCLNH
jgi:hypothetical protein